MMRSGLKSRVKKLERFFGVKKNRPTVILFEESDEEISGKAEELGLTLREFKKKVDNNEIGVVKIRFV